MAKKKKQVNAINLAIAGELAAAQKWCCGRNWWIRALLLVFMAYVLINHLRDPLYQSIFKGLDLGLHELGHYLFSPFGEFLNVAGGSIFQCLVPVLAMIMFRRQRDFFGIAVAMGWLSVNLFEVATYAADARTQNLDLVSPGASGDEIIHDWHWLLETTNMLQFDHLIAQVFRFSATISMIACLAFGAWLCCEMFKRPLKERHPV